MQELPAHFSRRASTTGSAQLTSAAPTKPSWLPGFETRQTKIELFGPNEQVQINLAGTICRVWTIGGG